VLWWHSHRWVDWWWRSWSIWGSGWSRVVLAAAPRQTDTRISNRIPLHLVDGHFSGMSLDELDKTASLSWWDLDIGDLAKALEERAELVLSDIAGQSSNENCGVIWIGELVHWLRSTVVTNWWSTHGVHADWSWHTGWSWPSLVLWGGRGDAHWAVSAVDTLHLSQGTLLIHLIRESDETVTARKAVDWVGHDLGRLARWEARLEEGNQDVFINLWSQVSDENGELWSTIIPKRYVSVVFFINRVTCNTYLRSVIPPPEAQFNLNGRLLLGMMVPFKVRALAAAPGVEKSMKQ
jgi:hypothetical protein